MNKKLLITGAGGYIGSITTYLLLQQGYEVIAFDNFTTGFKKPLELLQERFGSDQFRFYEADFTQDLSALFDNEKNIDAVIDFAASLSVNESMESPEKYFTNNVVGNQNLFQQMLKHDIKNIVFSSTCTVYGESQYLPIDENHPTIPNNVYGESKRMVEKMLEWYNQLKGMNYVILRYFNVCGASDDSFLGDAKKPSVHLVQNAVRGALGIEEFKITCAEVDTPDKTPIRDYTNVVDLAEAHITSVEYLLNGGKSEAINLGTGTGNSVYEIVKKVSEITGVEIPFVLGERRQGEATKVVASIDKARQVLGWEPKRDLEHTVKSLVAWYKANPTGYN